MSSAVTKQLLLSMLVVLTQFALLTGCEFGATTGSILQTKVKTLIAKIEAGHKIINRDFLELQEFSVLSDSQLAQIATADVSVAMRLIASRGYPASEMEFIAFWICSAPQQRVPTEAHSLAIAQGFGAWEGFGTPGSYVPEIHAPLILRVTRCLLTTVKSPQIQQAVSAFERSAQFQVYSTLGSVIEINGQSSGAPFSEGARIGGP